MAVFQAAWEVAAELSHHICILFLKKHFCTKILCPKVAAGCFWWDHFLLLVRKLALQQIALAQWDGKGGEQAAGESKHLWNIPALESSLSFLFSNPLRL